jgi:hypothetical protein
MQFPPTRVIPITPQITLRDIIDSKGCESKKFLAFINSLKLVKLEALFLSLCSRCGSVIQVETSGRRSFTRALCVQQQLRGIEIETMCRSFAL